MSLAIQNSENEIQSVWSMTTGRFFYLKDVIQSCTGRRSDLKCDSERDKG